jgi:hypothetical protein
MGTTVSVAGSRNSKKDAHEKYAVASGTPVSETVATPKPLPIGTHHLQAAARTPDGISAASPSSPNPAEEALSPADKASPKTRVDHFSTELKPASPLEAKQEAAEREREAKEECANPQSSSGGGANAGVHISGGGSPASGSLGPSSLAMLESKSEFGSDEDGYAPTRAASKSWAERSEGPRPSRLQLEDSGGDTDDDADEKRRLAGLLDQGGQGNLLESCSSQGTHTTLGDRDSHGSYSPMSQNTGTPMSQSGGTPMSSDFALSRATSTSSELGQSQEVGAAAGEDGYHRGIGKTNPFSLTINIGNAGVTEEPNWLEMVNVKEDDSVGDTPRTEPVTRRHLQHDPSKEADRATAMGNFNHDGLTLQTSDEMSMSFGFTNSGAWQMHGFEHPIRDTGISIGVHQDLGSSLTTINLMPVHQRVCNIKTLGKGCSATVYQCLDLNLMKLVALKTIQVYDSTKRHQMGHELSILYANMRDKQNTENIRRRSRDGAGDPPPDGPQHIVQFVDAFSGHPKGTVSIMLEIMTGGSLQDMIDKRIPLDDTALKCAACDCLKGLSYIHALKFLHRDIKPANILLTAQGVCKISDFGIGREMDMDGQAAQTFVGTMTYMSPERLNGEKSVPFLPSLPSFLPHFVPPSLIFLYAFLPSVRTSVQPSDIPSCLQIASNSFSPLQIPSFLPSNSLLPSNSFLPTFNFFSPFLPSNSFPPPSSLPPSLPSFQVQLPRGCVVPRFVPSCQCVR